MTGLRNIQSFSLDEFRSISGPLIDIRSPKEYSKGHWPGAMNMPLFNNKEREDIGLTYKEKGQKEAISIGIQLIIPKLDALKCSIETLNKKMQSDNKMNKSACLKIYCWRGGMRSKSLVWLLKLFKLNAIQLKGGYKTYRKWALKQFDKNWSIRLIGGKTGSGKTNLLHALALEGISTIDLEGLAKHKGSSFGSLDSSIQPSCEHYENLLAESLNSLTKNSNSHIWLEDESPNLGNCRIPNGLSKQMKEAPLIEIIKTKEERIEELVRIYSQYPKSKLKEATIRIKNRLGPQRTKIALDAISESRWEIACCAILDYYDRCYTYQLEKVEKRKKVDLSGLKIDIAAKSLIKQGLVY